MRRNGEKFFGTSIPVLCILFLLAAGCRGSRDQEPGAVSLGVFIPGLMSGSPIYEMLAQGVKRAAADFSREQSAAGGVEVTVIEGGYNQAEWESRITAMAASGNYDLIISSNPSLPAIAQAVSVKFPKQRFLLLDGEIQGNPMIYAMRYNQGEQAYMAGHIAALAALDLAAGKAPKIGLVAGQEYPVMNTIILPNYLKGARAADPRSTVDFRVVGNWFDAAKGAEIGLDMIREGTAVILPIAGGANEGVLRAAADEGAKVVWFDINGYALSPGTVVGSSVLRQDKAAYTQTKRFLSGELPFGRAEIVGAADGYVDFIEDDPDYIASVSPGIREKQGRLLARIRAGMLQLEE